MYIYIYMFPYTAIHFFVQEKNDHFEVTLAVELLEFARLF